jgi:hypothetical protein
MQAAAPGSRPWLAAAVVCGEQALLQQLKKGALMVMLGAVQVGCVCGSGPRSGLHAKGGGS